MLKIRINNEEVVSNKDFTINEEMLNTSSVILNNVYPKTWEEDKDYVSRFYHPNDYSKCMISDETDVPEEPGTTVEDTSFSINVDTTKEYEFTSYKGQTTQSGTPTPTAPQPINVVSGRQDVVVCGKNLLDYQYSNLNNITRSTASEETNGFKLTSTGVSGYGYGALTLDNSLLGQTITISMTSSGNKTPSGRLFYVRNNGTIGTNVGSFWTTNNSHTETLPSTIPSGSKAIALVLYISQGNNASGDYAIFKNIQVEKGNQATTYEAYKGNTYEINLGKNLSQLSSISTTNGGYINRSVSSMCEVEKGITYTLSFKNNSSYTNGCTVRVWHDNTYTDQLYKALVANSTMTYTFTATYSGTLHLSCKVANDTTDIFTEIQVEKGSQATTYAEYKTPIELCKIGNYQDRIFKSSGKNLFDKDNEQWTSGYITGSSATTLSPSAYNRTLYISCQPNTTYTIQKMVSVSSSRFFIASSVDVPNANVNIYNVYNAGDNSTTATYTTSSNAKYLLVNYMQTNTTTTTVEQMLNSIMINEGSTALPYEPYGTGWFIEKNIGKLVLNGSESWARSGASTSSSFVGAYNLQTSGIITMHGSASTWLLNRFTYGSLGADNKFNAYNGSASAGYQFLGLTVPTSIASDLASFKTWLSTHNTTVYYVQANPTYTEITDSELISQLEGIKLIEGLNNIGISTPYLPMIMNLHYNFVIPRTDVDILFCGVVKNSGNISLNPRDPHYQTLQILSYKTFLSEGETLDFVIYQKTIKEAIEQVVGVIADYGFVVGNINLTNGDEVIGAYSTKDKTAYDVFNYLADITQSRWTTRLIDENTVAIDFYDPTLLPLGTAIDYTNECFENHTIDNMSYSYGSNDYRNKQVMTSQEVYSNISQTQSVIANGYQTQFNVEQKIGKINYIKIGTTSYTIATNQEKEMGVSADFYYTPGNNYFESATTIAVGTSITVEYIPIVEGRQIISNSTEIDRIANSTGVKGVIARYENRNDAITSQELQKIGQSYIKYKGVPEIILTVQTRSNLWNIGDRVPFNAPIDELKTEYMVKAKKINYITTIDTIFYTYELTSSFNSENAINYFDNQRAKATGNIGSGEYISRNIDIQSDANIIFYDTTATEIEIVGDNTLEAVLEAPFVS